MVREHVNEKVQVKVDGKTKTVSIGQGLLLRIFREGLAGKKAASDQALRLMERFGIEDAPEPDDYDLSLLTLEELNELQRLYAKMMGKEAELQQEIAQKETESRTEYDRIWGSGSYDRLGETGLS